jgi:Flp pilus assembly protein TadG
MQYRQRRFAMRSRATLLRFRQDRDASVAIEFGLLIIPFVIVLFAILESCASFAAQQVMSNATDELARQIRTGQLKDPTETTLKAAICARLQVMVTQSCPGLQIDLREIATFEEGSQHTFKIESATGGEKQINLYKGTQREQFQWKAGGAVSRNMIRVFYRWPIMTDLLRGRLSNFGDSSTLLYAATVWKNEPF